MRRLLEVLPLPGLPLDDSFWETLSWFDFFRDDLFCAALFWSSLLSPAFFLRRLFGAAFLGAVDFESAFLASSAEPSLFVPRFFLLRPFADFSPSLVDARFLPAFFLTVFLAAFFGTDFFFVTFFLAVLFVAALLEAFAVAFADSSAPATFFALVFRRSVFLIYCLIFFNIISNGL